MRKIRDLEIINKKKNKLANIEKIAIDKNIFLNLENTTHAIKKNILQEIIATNKSLGQFKYKHILFLPQPPAKIIFIIPA